MRSGQRGLGPEPAAEFAFQPGTLVLMDERVHTLEGVVTDVQTDEAGQRLIYVRPWNGEARPYLQEDLTLITGREASTIDRFIRSVLKRSALS